MCLLWCMSITMVMNYVEQAYNKIEGEFDVVDEGVMGDMVGYLGVAVGRCLVQGRDMDRLEQQAAAATAEANKITVSYNLGTITTTTTTSTTKTKSLLSYSHHYSLPSHRYYLPNRRCSTAINHP